MKSLFMGKLFIYIHIYKYGTKVVKKFVFYNRHNNKRMLRHNNKMLYRFS